MWLSFLLILAVGLSSHLSRSCLSLAFLRASRLPYYSPSSWPSCRACPSGWRPGFNPSPSVSYSLVLFAAYPHAPPSIASSWASAISSPVEALRLQGCVSSSSFYSLDLRLEFAFYLGPVPACGAPCPVVQFVIYLSAVFQLVSPTRVRASRVNH
jgi:hypothetical protein